MLIRLAAILGFAASALTGCTTTHDDFPTDPVVIDAGRYDAAFDAARQVLRDQGFVLERVDAAAGVITTREKTTAGIATPWDREQSSVEQEVADLLQRQQRVVRITFDRTAAGLAAERVAMSVDVTVLRVHQPGFKIEPEAIRQSSFFFDPALGSRGLQPNYAVAVEQDVALADRITCSIRQRIALSDTPSESIPWQSPKPLREASGG